MSVDDLVGEGVDWQHATDWLINRKAKGLPLTATALAQTKAEAAKAGLPLAKAIAFAAGHGWAGFKASWMVDGESGKKSTAAAETQASLAQHAAVPYIAPPLEILARIRGAVRKA